jgi:hypothetical protein
MQVYKLVAASRGEAFVMCARINGIYRRELRMDDSDVSRPV